MNGVKWQDAFDRAKDALNQLDNTEFLELIGRHIEYKLLYKEDAK